LVLLAVLAVAPTCGGGQAPPTKPPTPTPTPPFDPCAGMTVAPQPLPPPTPIVPDTPPELFPPKVTKVGVGQTVHFSVAAIDQDLDETRVMVTAMPKSATFDAITQMVSFTPTKADLPKATFELAVSQPGRGTTTKHTWTIAVDPKAQPVPVAPEQTPMIETVLMIRQTKRLEQVNKDWPFDRMLLAGAETFKHQLEDDVRAKLTRPLDKAALFESFLVGMAQTHDNPRLDPKSPWFDKVVFGDPAAWKIVAVRPRIDRNWTEMRVVYRAVKAPEPTFAMFRIRPSVEYVPPLPRPPIERATNNKTFLGMVSKHLLVNGGPNPKFVKDQGAHGKAVAALVNELMAFDASKDGHFHRVFAIGIATEAQMGGGSARNSDGSYRSGDAWAWSAMKPFPSADGTTQRWTNVVIPGFWTQTIPSVDGSRWIPTCAPKYTKGAPGHVPGWEVLCRPTLGFVDLPVVEDNTLASADPCAGHGTASRPAPANPCGGGQPAPANPCSHGAAASAKVRGGRVDANNLYIHHKLRESQLHLPLDDGRRDIGEENGMTCSQCHIRNFGMHDYGDPANTDPRAGVPKTRNKKLATLNFQIVPSTHWEAFTIDFLHHQECRGKNNLEEALGTDAAKGFTCPLAK
jgi:hypothetical protein